jgi:hypothetical protein
LLDALGSSDALAQEYRGLHILRQCAGYQLRLAEQDLEGARASLEALSDFKDETGFYNDFALQCGLSYDEALADLQPTPTPWPTTAPRTPAPGVTCQPALPQLVAPAENATHCSWCPVEFSWEGGQLCEGQEWVVVISGGGEYLKCEPTSQSSCKCKLTLSSSPSGKSYTWAVEIHTSSGVVPNMRSPGRNLTLREPSSGSGGSGGGLENE